MSVERTALLFPGQGAQTEGMFEHLRDKPEFQARYATLRGVLGEDLLARVHDRSISIRANLPGSLLTILASAVILDLVRKDRSIDGTVAGVAGYSVGQWTALYAASGISFEQLIRIVERRASFMDQCAAAHPGTMIAVIGIGEVPLQDFCAELRRRGLFAAIANYNAPGQYTLSAESRAVPVVLEEIRALNPIKCIEIQTAGPWHCELMDDAGRSLADLLENERLCGSDLPVIDNVTGSFLPADPSAARTVLAEQVCRPVQWSRGIQTLVAAGITRFLEVGSGNMLTKFGFFIDRTVRHESWSAAG